jgi:mono/diheme cytochrome c family protein
MKFSLGTKALTCALVAALLSLGGAWMMSVAIKLMSDSNSVQAASPAPNAFSTLVATPEIINQGHEFFGQSCSECHGDDAHGDEGPDLHRLSISNARIAATIKKGIKGEMPTFSKKYNDVQIAALVTYLRTLQ